ncbi:hypothetical protein AMJ71_08905 [candidate division TA06 bacterium SM1_40]|uniref:Periplasmic copper-binding protein NosD beta helix domain-containing protein n=1 Tax=candidate division TA06 bacterium SM1_40 TaxID=1703773 RepID=A0A0S8JCT3_UNCT6|nr:MAG: hypothetical protein AMJ71_08905 [candidate division TA06 bacterium SM1_40]
MITGNAGVIGGGIRCHGVSPAIIGNRITANSAEWGGGIICDGYSFPAITQNTVAGNSATLGAGILCWAYSSAEVRNNIIALNAASECGGGIHCWRHSSMTLAGNTITGNTANERGGGIHCLDHSTMTLSGSTVAENRASAQGGGVDCYGNSSITVMNSILWGDSALTGPEVSLDTSSSITISYSDVEGGWPGGGNIDADPVFVLAEKGDYRLLWGSPCIDSGHPDSLDQDGTRSDMGAHFFDQEDYLTLYLTPDTTEVLPGGELGVTYTLINRWAQPEALWILTQVILPRGGILGLCGPDRYTLPAHFVTQRHLDREVPATAPQGTYVYRSGIGVPPAVVYDRDEFTFVVAQP